MYSELTPHAMWKTFKCMYVHEAVFVAESTKREQCYTLKCKDGDNLYVHFNKLIGLLGVCY